MAQFNSKLQRGLIAGALALSGVFLVRNAYFGIIGDLMFVDTLGSSDPDWTGLGGTDARFPLVYLAPADLPASAFLV